MPNHRGSARLSPRTPAARTPTGHIVEIAAPRVVHPDYWGLAALANWSYTITPATPVPGTGDETTPINHDLTADVAALREALHL